MISKISTEGDRLSAYVCRPRDQRRHHYDIRAAVQRESSFGFKTSVSRIERGTPFDRPRGGLVPLGVRRRGGAAHECSFRRRKALRIRSNDSIRAEGALFGRRAPLERGEGHLRRVVGVFLRSADDPFLHRQALAGRVNLPLPHGAASRAAARAQGDRVFAFRFRDICHASLSHAPTRGAIRNDFADGFARCGVHPLVSFLVVMSWLLCLGFP